MKRGRQSVNARRSKVLAMIRERQTIKVEDLASFFGVSLMTIRRDLQVLEEKGLIGRFYGGATVDPHAAPMDEEDEVELYRQLIARYAASRTAEGDHIFINGSSTALGLLNYVGGKNIRVFTNNGAAVGREYPSGVEVTLSGGSLRGPVHILTGDCAMRNLLMTRANRAFLGCSGISPDGEILCGIPTELGINETMISHAYEYYILADHTKIGKAGTYASFSLEKAGTIITDEKAPANVVEQLRIIGMTVIQVGRDDFPSEEED